MLCFYMCTDDWLDCFSVSYFPKYIVGWKYVLKSTVWCSWRVCGALCLELNQPLHFNTCTHRTLCSGSVGRGWYGCVNKSPEQWLLCDRQVRIIQYHLHVAFEFLELLSFELINCIYYLFVCLLQIQCNAILVVSIQRLNFFVCLNLSFIDYQTKLQWLAIG